MKLNRLELLALVATALVWGGTASAGAPPHAAAGSTITNVATVEYDIGGNPQPPVDSPTDTITVDELIDVDVTRQSANPVITLSPATDQPIRFTVTNLGNGSEQFNLTGNLALGPDFNPTNLEFYIDDGDNVFEPGAGDGAPVASITLAAETTGTVWFVADIPGTAVDGELGNIDMTATSATGTGVAGTVFAGAGTGGVDAVIGTSEGDDTDVGGYEVSNITFTVGKTSTVLDQFGGTDPVPGATITYTITVTTAGSGTADNIVVTDDVPPDTTYVPGSMTLNAAPETDIADAGACDFDDTNPGGIHCALGTITGASLNTVTFQVVIN